MLTLITQEETEEGQGKNGNSLALSPSPWASHDPHAAHERAGDSSSPQLILDQWTSVSFLLSHSLPHPSPHSFTKPYSVSSSVLGTGVTQWWTKLFVSLQSLVGLTVKQIVYLSLICLSIYHLSIFYLPVFFYLLFILCIYHLSSICLSVCLSQRTQQAPHWSRGGEKADGGKLPDTLEGAGKRGGTFAQS